MTESQQTLQALEVNRYNWTQQAWDEEAKNPNLVGAKKWRDLDTGFQRFLLAKTQGCTTKDEVKKALEAK